MSDGVMVATTKALTTHIEGLTLSLTPETIERSYADWEKPLESTPLNDAEGLRVDIVPVTNAQEIALVARGHKRHTVPIDIAIRRRLAANEQDEDTGRIPVATVDALVNYTEELFNSLIPIRLADYEEASWVSTAISVLPFREHLIQRQFTAVIRVVFTVKKAVTT